ncbi:MAG: hypothetical protein AMS21_13455 [Gemmatimonas sp. SG8_38_2]|nr:MAG: hypothetical protein AMS21_13455 [Gemmatimonas sp. SG8_38_2]
MCRPTHRRLLLTIGLLLLPSARLWAQDETPSNEARFPVTATVLVDSEFARCEGIAFNGEGELYVAGNAALWKVSTAPLSVNVTS